MKQRFNELIKKLNIRPGFVMEFPEGFAIARAIIPNDEVDFHKARNIVFYWNDKFYQQFNGWFPNNEHFVNDKEYLKTTKYDSHWMMYPEDASFKRDLFEKVYRILKSKHFSNKKLQYRYYAETKGPIYVMPKATTRVISNRNLCKIDNLKLKGDVSGLYGKVPTSFGIIDFGKTAYKDTIWGTVFCLEGEVNPYLYGDITGIEGTIHKDLYGDISGITGCITHLVGDCTGITLHINEPLCQDTDIKMLIEKRLSGNARLLSNEESQKAFNAYRKLAHCTLGLSKTERDLIDEPYKYRPPFPIDRWGRYYVEKGDKIYVYSINPCDIMFLKEVGPLYSCFCITSQSNAGRWAYGMRCLMALNCNNPSFGCMFIINKHEPTRRMRMFKDLDFKWFKPTDGCFFQYNTNGEAKVWKEWIDVEGLFKPLKDDDSIVPIFGHDGIDCGHAQQDKMAYLEIFIEREHSWVGCRATQYESANKITNNDWDQCFDENWNKTSASGRIINKDMLNKFIEEAKMAKEIINGIEV